ncbi:lipoyl(octanoyl) transferase LipB [Mangrovibacterium marinum]|uniref:Octanoyltransferase n=1 Tax=Mangrovibacterium marinum TaxID=1639118 RepID=A0A2T5BYB7_9BACT|nr:lipoyl(octanoyl) transferase LipB [Mangrovibacterium marinum]PTN07236.1 lipoyl(octanoyl) transferase [Mangrovibacterium marinum]
MANFTYEDIGLKDYKECWDYQESILKEIQEAKKATGKATALNRFLLVEHPHVYTLGKSGDEHNLLVHGEFLKKIEATYYKINRGGDITYHGPGQLVGYPIIDLEYYHIGVREYIEKMEDAIIATLAHYGITGGRKKDATGVWLDSDIPAKARKICAIGVRVSRYVTMHGFALNVNTDMRYFNYINPCGFISYGVTSLEQELGHRVDLTEVKEIVQQKFNAIY